MRLQLIKAFRIKKNDGSVFLITCLSSGGVFTVGHGVCSNVSAAIFFFFFKVLEEDDTQLAETCLCACVTERLHLKRAS